MSGSRSGEAPFPRLRRHRFSNRRVDFSRPMEAARLYEGGRGVVLARLEPRPGSTLQETVPMTLSEMRRQTDIERGYIDRREDRPSALIGTPDASRGIAILPGPGLGQTTSEYPVQISPEMSPYRGLAKRQPVDRRSIPKFQPRSFRGTGATAIEMPRKVSTPSLLFPATALRGIGAGDETAGLALGAVGVLMIALSAAGGYFAGAAMAPDRNNKVTYGVVGSVLGLFTGPIGLGVLGLVALSKK